MNDVFFTRTHLIEDNGIPTSKDYLNIIEQQAIQGGEELAGRNSTEVCGIVTREWRS